MRDETERKELQEQSQALRAAAKQRLKQQSKQARGHVGLHAIHCFPVIAAIHVPQQAV